MRQNRIEAELRTIRELLETQDEALSFPEACKFLHVSKGHLYMLTSNRHIPFSKPGGKKLFFSKRALTKWLLQNPMQPKEELLQSVSSTMRKAG